MHDPDDSLEERPGSVLMAVGSRVTSPATLELLRQAGRQAYHAVVVKDRGADLAPLIEAAREAGVALLVASEQIPWRQLDALLTAAISGLGETTTTYSAVGMGDLFALANTIASTIGGATCIEDAQGNVPAHSNIAGQEIDEIRKLGILGRKTPKRPTNRTEYSRVFRADGPVGFSSLELGHTPRLATAVRAGAQLLGFIWVLDGATSESAAVARLGLRAHTPVAIVAFAPAVPEPGTAVASIADLMITECDPTGLSGEELRRAPVLGTLLGGRWTHRRSI